MKYPPFKELIIYEDDNLMVVNKPAFLATLDERSGEGLSLKALAKQYCADAQLCHRLDKETSGALVIAKTPSTYRHVSMQFEKRSVKKTYHAVVEGHQEFNDLLVDLPILNLGKGHVKISKREGKKSETYFNSLEYFKHYTLLECQPLSGRMHQIRIHLATQKATICMDETYGGQPVFLSSLKSKYRSGKQEEEQSIIKRFALHARQIEFTLENGESLAIEAPYPKDFAVLLKLLRKFDA